MATPCPSCNKFCALETQEPEVNSYDVDGHNGGGTVTCEARVVRTSECCYEEMKEFNYELEESFEHDCPKAGEDEEPTYSVEEPDLNVDESGGGRYQKNMITCWGTATVTCDLCEAEIEVELKDEAAASFFDELV